MKLIHIIAIVIIAIAIGVIISSSNEYSEYSEFATAIDNSDNEYHIVGSLDKTKPQIYDPVKDPNYFEFYLIDQNNQIEKVIYKGSKPDGFDQTEKIVIAGNYNQNHFNASQILMKCPSKYIDENKDITK